MMIRFAILAVLFFTGLTGTAHAVHAKGELKDIPLVWKPTIAVSSQGAIDLTAFKTVTLLVRPFTDARKNPADIGRNLEQRRGEPEFAVTTKDSVAQWLTTHVAQTIREFEVDVAKENGTLFITGEVVKFFVTEKAVYEAEVGLKIRLISKTENVLWEGMISAKSTRWGKSYNADNYYEALSDATIAVVFTLLKNEQFTQAVQKSK